MPSDSSGNYTLPPGYLAIAGTTIQPSEHNPPLEDVASALTLRLMTSGANPMTAQLRIADGVVGKPGLSFNSDQTSGWYKTTAGWGFSISGVEVLEFTAGGITKGSRAIGELFAWTGTNAPALSVLPRGQTLLRTSYPDLWTFVQAEIALGNAFYNNGNGSTTFGVGDTRNRVLAGVDNHSAGRLTSTTISPDGSTIGGTGGAETVTLTLATIPTNITSFNGTAIGLAVTSGHSYLGNGTAIQQLGAGTQGYGWSTVPALEAVSSSGSLVINAVGVTSSNTSGGAHINVQPTIITNFALFAGA